MNGSIVASGLIGAVLLGACGGSGGSNNGGSDGNDTLATAQAVALGSTTSGTIASSTDDDWYRFTTTSAGMVVVTLGGLAADANLALVDETSVAVATSVNEGTSDETVSHAAAGAATFYVHVIPQASATPYTLVVNFVPAGGDGNDTFATAQAVAVGSTTSGVAASSTDDDWYKFTTLDPGTVLVRLEGLSADANLALHDSGEALLASSSAAGTAADLVTYAAGAAGTFYAHVIPGATASAYTLRVGFVAAGADGNDTFGTAQAVPVDTTVTGAISGVTDDDWYVVTAPKAGTFTATLHDLFGDADLELFGELSNLQVDGSYFAGTTPDVVTYTYSASAPIAFHVRVVALGSVTPYALTVAFTP